MAEKSWVFDTRAKRYRDETSGRFLAKATVSNLRDRIVNEGHAQARELGGQVVRGEITTSQFRASMRDLIRDTHVASYVFGRGGFNAMTQADFGRIGGTLAGQYRYLDRFVSALDQGLLSEAQASVRAQQYINASNRAYEQGNASAWDVENSLPTYPGELCLGHYYCKCSWDYHDTPDAIEATWTLGDNENHCEACIGLARTYRPLVIPKYSLSQDREPMRFRAMPRMVRAS